MFQPQREEWSGVMAASVALLLPVVTHPSASLHCFVPAWQNTAYMRHTYFLLLSLSATAQCFEDMPPAWCGSAMETHKQAHMLFPNSAPWLTRWYVLFLRPQPIRQEDTNLPQQVKLKATGHYLWPISALTTQTEEHSNNWRTRLLCSHLPLLNLASVVRTPANTRKSQPQRTFLTHKTT